MTLVTLVDDHRLFSASMAVALRAEGLDVEVPALSSLASVRDAIEESRPAVVMLDRDLGPLGSGEALIAPIAEARCPVMVVSGSLDDVAAGRCLALGATVCLPKSDPFDVLLDTVVRVAKRDTVVCDAERYRLIDTWRGWRASADAMASPFAQLTGREASVLRALMDGRSVKGIANDSFVSEATVRTQVRGILTKLGCTSQLEAVAMALRAGWHSRN